jgi:hypothetical protein
MTQWIKKKVMIMVHEIKNSETKKLSRLGIHNRFWVWLAGLAAVFGLIQAFGATFSTVFGIYLGYRALRLAMRLIGQVLRIVFTVISIIILIAIISLIIF